jgi:hypothetical protein
MRSWRVEGSVDGADWKELDRRENDQTLTGKAQTATFRMENPLDVRMIKISELGRNSNNCYCLEMSALEIFGVLINQP